MDRPKQKINVTKFLADFRSGCSDEELARKHDLKQSALKKLVRVLEQKQLLSLADLENRAVAAARAEASVTGLNQPDLPRSEEFTSACPQCGAAVTEKLLTCPECGHVLPGEERWSNLEPRKGLLERVPPIVWGCIIALPIGLLVFYTFKGMLVSMRTTAAEKAQKSAAAAARSKKTSTGTEKPLAKGQGAPDMTELKRTTPTEIEMTVEFLRQEGVILSANEDYTRFAAGDRWAELSRSQRIGHVETMAAALERSGIAVGFTIATPANELLARVDGQRIDLIDKDGFTDSVERVREEAELR